MPNYIEYQQSISKELMSIKDRVRNFIDDHHWSEDGRYKEIILSHVLRQHLPKGISVGTGFVVNNGNITKQIDIIVYRDDIPLLFKQDDFLIAPAECVLGIIEVKSRATTQVCCDAIHSATENGKTIDRAIFNGIFAFENDSTNLQNENLLDVLNGSAGIVNYICLGKDKFVKYWDAGMPRYNLYENRNYAVYGIEDLAFGYFISNLVEDIYISMHGQQIPETLRDMFYPIEDTKEAHRSRTIDIGELNRYESDP